MKGKRRKVNTAQSEEGEYLSPHSFQFHGLKNKQANICVNIWSCGSESAELYIVVEDKHTFSYFSCLLHEFRSIFEELGQTRTCYSALGEAACEGRNLPLSFGSG